MDIPKTGLDLTKSKSLTPTPVRWSNFGPARIRPLGLCIADMDMEPPCFALAALSKIASNGQLRYLVANEATRDSIVKWLLRRHNWSISGSSIVILPMGPKAGMRLLLHALADLRRPVIVPTPIYSGLLKIVQQAGATLVDWPLLTDNKLQYAFDLSNLQKCATRSGAATILLCNPHNPVGRVWTSEELLSIGEIATKLGMTVLSDEIFADLTHSPSIYVPYCRCFPDNLCASIYGIGKAFNVSGIPWSFAIVPRLDARDRVLKLLKGWGYHEGSIIGDEVANAVFGEGDAWLENRRNELFTNVSRTRDALVKFTPPLVTAPVEAGYLIWVRATDKLSTRDIAEDIYQAVGIRVLDGIRFGSQCRGFFRMNVAVQPDVLNEAINRLSSFFSRFF